MSRSAWVGCWSFPLPALMMGTGVLAQTRVKVSGVITSAEDKLPIIGAAVMDSAGNGVITDLDGRYEIEAESSSELLFSCFGYLDVKKTVPDLPSCTINVEMETESLKLEDAVVIAYGVRKKEDFLLKTMILPK